MTFQQNEDGTFSLHMDKRELTSLVNVLGVQTFADLKSKKVKAEDIEAVEQTYSVIATLTGITGEPQ